MWPIAEQSLANSWMLLAEQPFPVPTSLSAILRLLWKEMFQQDTIWRYASNVSRRRKRQHFKIGPSSNTETVPLLWFKKLLRQTPILWWLLTAQLEISPMRLDKQPCLIISSQLGVQSQNAHWWTPTAHRFQVQAPIFGSHQVVPEALHGHLPPREVWLMVGH